jgi:hypothetical protein
MSHVCLEFVVSFDSSGSSPQTGWHSHQRSGQARHSDQSQSHGRARHSGYASPPGSGETCRSNSFPEPRRWQADIPGWTMILPG